ncbi:homocysteine S-methyltransferase family protein [Phyllobacterium sophorae]|uniref:Homocysteine S-methyltransferase n=1 Tax=Phyllobacterium sophorae TaxID=1520277 RepID=A0A2P7BFC6_9HYPH|nr:homocysteine S-methyltransferase family protein [Phyllobacterium sophorae]PSH65196.1 homocysteine S-methyltransferase [Phyllobacterium sophorae]
MTNKQIGFTILDGGMGRLLERLGAPFRLPEWSALSLIEAPSFVTRAHTAYVESGAEIITTNSYGLVPHMIGEQRFADEGRLLADRAGRLAREVADNAPHNVLVAGSLPPLFESYRPDNFIAEDAPRILSSLVAGLAPHVDVWLIETQSSTLEALTALAVVKDSGLPIFVSYTLKDEHGRTGPPELRSGETVAEAVAVTLDAGANAVLFNCSQPEVMSEAILAARRVIDASSNTSAGLGVYANAFMPEPPSDEPYAGISEIRADLDPDNYLKWVGRWVEQGATIVGGCCGIGPEHISAISASRDSPSKMPDWGSNSPIKMQ